MWLCGGLWPVLLYIFGDGLLRFFEEWTTRFKEEDVIRKQ